MPKEEGPKTDYSAGYKIGAFLVTTMAAYGLMRKGNYRVALELYSRGGGGLNLYKDMVDGQKQRRIFAIDYHTFWNSKTQQKECGFHYHYGKSKEEIKKHRPYDGW
jgi:hypothetical protein